METKNHIETVAVVGAGGNIGTFITSALQKEGKMKVTAIARVGSSSTIPTGVTVKNVDYEDLDALTEALRGQDALVITMSGQAPQSTQLGLVEAAAAAGVRWIVPNWYGPDARNAALMDGIGLAEHAAPVQRRIEELGVSAWVGVSCGFWYEYSLAGGSWKMGPHMYGFDLAGRTAQFIDDGTTRINTSTMSLVGLAVARLLALPERSDGDAAQGLATLSRFRNDWVFVSSFRASQRDMLDSVLRVTGTKEREWSITSQDHEERYDEGIRQRDQGDYKGFAKVLYTRVFFPNGDGDFESKYGLHNDLLGLPSGEDIDAATKRAFEYAEIPL